MLRWPLNPDNEMLDETVLAKCFRELNPWDRSSLLHTYLCHNIGVPIDDVILKSSLFLERQRQIISMISVILGKDDDQVIDNFFLGCLMSICPFTMKPLTKFNYAKFILDKIHYQLSKFETLRSFKYQSYLVHLFLFSQAIHFSHLGLKIEDEIGNLVLVIHWTYLLKKNIQNVWFLEYVN
jgi:hypothetical protein